MYILRAYCWSHRLCAREGFDRYAGSSFALRLGAELFPLPERGEKLSWAGVAVGLCLHWRSCEREFSVTTILLVVKCYHDKIVDSYLMAASLPRSSPRELGEIS